MREPFERFNLDDNLSEQYLAKFIYVFQYTAYRNDRKKQDIFQSDLVVYLKLGEFFKCDHITVAFRLLYILLSLIYDTNCK